MGRTRIGIVGYGHLGQYLTEKILNDPRKHFELAFVWNRSKIQDQNLDSKYILEDLDSFSKYNADLIIEVAHPVISEKYGEIFLEHANYVIGSPTALANKDLLDRLNSASEKNSRKIYVPCGAFWGAQDIKKMADCGSLKGLRVSMKKHPDSLKVEGKLKEKLESSLPLQSELVLYQGPVRDLCHLAPNNVNTMAVGAICAHNLGFDGVEACLVADPALTDKHIVEIEVTGPLNTKLNQNFKCTTTRSNPAQVGHVTGTQTYDSFYNSLLETVDDANQHGISVC